MFIKFILALTILYNNSAFAETYIKDLEIVNDIGTSVFFKVEVALKRNDQIKGLMFREHLDNDEGMLFLFETEKNAKFWMKNTYIPLDIIFINKNGTVNNLILNTKPMSLKPIKSKGKVLAVLEVNAGEIEANKIGYKSIIKLKQMIYDN